MDLIKTFEFGNYGERMCVENKKNTLTHTQSSFVYINILTQLFVILQLQRLALFNFGYLVESVLYLYVMKGKVKLKQNRCQVNI